MLRRQPHALRTSTRRAQMTPWARRRAASAAALLVASGVAHAETLTWDAPAATPSSWFEPLNWSLDRLPTSADATYITNSGTAQIATGSAAAGQLFLGSTAAQTGFLNQSAGSLSVTDLTVASHSEYLFGGGSLRVESRFNLLGELDFNSGSAAVTLADNATLDFSRGLLRNAANASITAGRGTTIYLPVGVNPYTFFGSFTTQGDVFNSTGPLLIIPAGFVMNATQDRPDRMRVEGTLRSRDENGNVQSFTASKGGFEVAGGGLFEVLSNRSLSVQSDSAVSGGTLTATGHFTVGAANRPTVFTQTGGAVTQGTAGYGQTLSVRDGSRYEQGGGTLNVAEDLTLSGGSRYSVSGGTASVGDELIVSASGDLFRQTGGTVTVSKMRGQSGSRFEVGGGTLNIGKRFDLATGGTVDLGTGNATINLSTFGVLDWSAGSVLGGGGATYTAGVQSESYFPAGFDPRTRFENFSSQGLVHTLGTTLVVPSNFQMNATQDRADRMRVEGTLRARDENGNVQSFTASRGGVEVAAGGVFEVASNRSLSVQSDSAVSGGTLTATGHFTVGTTNRPTVFTQTGGAVTQGTSGYGHTLSVRDGSRYEQSAGTLSVAEDLAASGGSRYVLGGGNATVGDELIVSASGDVFRQTGGTANVSKTRVFSGGRAELAGGTLNVGKRFDLGAGGTVDLGSGNATINVASFGVVDWSAGTVLGGGGATYSASFQSESYFPVGFQPYATFRGFSSAGLVHSTGTRILVPVTYSGRIQRLQVQGLDVSGDITLDTGGEITATESVRVLGGRLGGAGTITASSVLNSGTIAPGFSPGRLTIQGPYAQSSSGTLEMELATTGTYDVLAITGAASLAGTLDIHLLNPAGLSWLSRFDNVVSYGSRSGQFEVIDLAGAAPGMGVAAVYGTDGLDLVYARIGDANLDGVVSVNDMATLRWNLGATGSRATWQTGDFDYDGRVTPRDLMLLRGNFGDRLSAAPQTLLAAVPEPAAPAALLLAAALPALRRRRRLS